MTYHVSETGMVLLDIPDAEWNALFKPGNFEHFCGNEEEHEAHQYKAQRYRGEDAPGVVKGAVSLRCRGSLSLRAWLIEQLKWEMSQSEHHGAAYGETGRVYHLNIMKSSRAAATAYARTIDRIDGKL